MFEVSEMTNEWFQQQLAEMEAAGTLVDPFAECARARCREFGDCSEQCRFFPVTASPSEKEEVKRIGADSESKKKRLWEGPREPVKGGDA